MISFKVGSTRFNYRSVGVLIEDGTVLLHRDRKDDFWALPGGRVEIGETARDAIVRELREELDVSVTVDRVLWFVENFFEYDGQGFHEVSIYFLLGLGARSHLLDAVSFDGVENDTNLTYRWFPVSGLEGIKLYPAFLTERLACLPASTEYIVWHDDANAG